MGQPAQAEPELAVSVVMPVLNEARDIGGVLFKVLSQRCPSAGFEVLVVDGGSVDDTRAIVSELADEWPNLRLIENPGKLSSSGRNIGARAARGRYILYLDGHCSVPRNDYLVRLVELFESTGAACLCRPQPLNHLAEGTWATAISAARHSWLGHNAGSDIYSDKPGFTDPHSAGAAYLRTVIEQLSGYDERFDACEDVEFNHRVAMAGHRSYLHPDLTVYYRVRSTPRGLFRQMVRYGRGRARLMAKHRRLVPWPLVMITAIGVVAVAGFVGGRAAVTSPFLGISLGAWLLVAAIESFRLSRGLPAALRHLTAFFVIHAGLLIGFLNGIAGAGAFLARPSGGSRWAVTGSVDKPST